MLRGSSCLEPAPDLIRDGEKCLCALCVLCGSFIIILQYTFTIFCLSCVFGVRKISLCRTSHICYLLYGPLETYDGV
jgi:hypothetical protein